jgi:hypothetical protein
MFGIFVISIYDLISLSILDMYITNLLLDIYENMQLVLPWQWHNRELRGVCQSNL